MAGNPGNPSQLPCQTHLLKFSGEAEYRAQHEDVIQKERARDGPSASNEPENKLSKAKRNHTHDTKIGNTHKIYGLQALVSYVHRCLQSNI